MARNDPVTVSVEFVTHAAGAVLVKDGDEEAWIPKSQIDDGEDNFDWDTYERGDTVDFDIPEWLAEDKGLW